MKSNAMAGAVSLVGIGICGIAVAMLLQTVGPRAEASPRGADAFVFEKKTKDDDEDALFFFISESTLA